ncbi:MerC domain-containing protein [Chitinophaga agrisoli]|uniref:MerC domain-containing protein n=1 Tax=Chitinophaga agrisoli TaxID=2607653 RepID=A0A5B2W1I4_9BACT|nr:MerC domain-containing protein [Chitinophaga agrisoli]KAA2244768.1 MerC domain-containing protein [Chitinophaga agrisoli]
MSDKFLRKLNLDAWGIGASLLCAVHCAVLPLMMMLLPLMGFQLLENEALEYGLMGFTFLVGSIALYRGYRYHHRQGKPLLLFITGLVLLLLGHFLQTGLPGLGIIATGALFIIIAHWWNLRQCRHYHKTAA